MTTETPESPSVIDSVAPPLGVWDVDAQTYHANNAALSNSMLKTFIASIPRYHGQYVTGAIPRPESSDDQVVGTALHCFLLEGEDAYAAQFATGPEGDKRTKDVKAAWVEFEETLNGRTALTVKQADLVQAMYNAVLDNPHAVKLLDAIYKVEHTITWNEGALHCKARIDGMSNNHDLIIDVKTIDDCSPESFQRAVLNYGYHRQQQFYKRGCLAVHGTEPTMYFIVVSKAAPSECAVYLLDEAFEELADNQIDIALEEMLTCRADDVWESRHIHSIRTLEAPRWALK